VIFWVLTKEVPFPSSNRRFSFAQGVAPFPVENLQARDVSDQGIKFLQVLISADPLKRPTALAALESLWITPSVPAIDGKNTMDTESKADSGEPDLSHTSQDAKTSNEDDAVTINFNALEVSNSSRETKSGESGAWVDLLNRSIPIHCAKLGTSRKTNVSVYS
jgi:serine/threonine protein kinase